MMESDHKCLRSLPRLICRTCLCRATPLRRHPPVSFAKKVHHPRNPRNPHQRPSPPDLARQRHRRVRPAVLASVAQQQTHLHHQIVARHSQQRPHPRACRPFPSVYSLTSEIIAASSSLLCVLCELCVLCVKSFSSNLPLQLSTSSRLFSQQRNHLPPELHHTFQRPGRHPDNLFEQPGHRRQKLQHALQPLARVRIASCVRFHLLHALRQHIQRRVDFPPLSFLGNDPENLPHVLDRFEVVAPVAQHVHHAHDPPALQLAQARAHVRARHRQGCGNLIRRHRSGRQKQQRVHLRHGSVDSPPRAHLPPMQNKLLRHRRQPALGWFAHFTPPSVRVVCVVFVNSLISVISLYSEITANTVCLSSLFPANSARPCQRRGVHPFGAHHLSANLQDREPVARLLPLCCHTFP